MKKTVKLPINIAVGEGGYTVDIVLGSKAQKASVLLDTGSSTLAVEQSVYQPEKDASLKTTSYAQDITYGQGGWVGPVIKTSIGLFTHQQEHVVLEDGPIATIAVEQQNNFRNANGIWGLAYHHLNRAYDLSHWFVEKGEKPDTFPWPFSVESTPEGVKNFKQFLKKYPEHDISPAFTELEQRDVVSNRFGLLTQRAIVHTAKSAMSLEEKCADPMNKGLFILGDAVADQVLHNGDFEYINVLHDAYYNVHLMSIKVDGFEACQAPEIDPQHVHNYFSNGIIDSGSSYLVLQAQLYDYVISCFNQISPELDLCIKAFEQARAGNSGYLPLDFDYGLWPAIIFTFQDPQGGCTEIKVLPQQYWQENALQHSAYFFLLLRQLEHWPNQSILGLPLMNKKLFVFDRSTGSNGVVAVASSDYSFN